MGRLRRVSLVDKSMSMRQDRGVNSVANHQGIITELQWRGLIAQNTDLEALTEACSNPITLYCGFDPTWYKKDVTLARRKVEEFLKQNPESPVMARGRSSGDSYQNTRQ